MKDKFFLQILVMCFQSMSFAFYFCFPWCDVFFVLTILFGLIEILITIFITDEKRGEENEEK